jgi:hypothetical protein
MLAQQDRCATCSCSAKNVKKSQSGFNKATHAKCCTIHRNTVASNTGLQCAVTSARVDIRKQLFAQTTEDKRGKEGSEVRRGSGGRTDGARPRARDALQGVRGTPAQHTARPVCVRVKPVAPRWETQRGTNRRGAELECGCIGCEGRTLDTILKHFHKFDRAAIKEKTRR